MMTALRAWKFEAGVAKVFAGLALLSTLSSCVTRGNVDLLEAQLRTQESALRNYESKVSRLESDLRVSQRELDLLRTNASALNVSVAMEEVSGNIAKVEEFAFNSYFTAGQDQDDVAGDERFFALISPYDAQGSTVKISGRLELEAIDPSRPSGDRSLGRWTYTPDESRQLWHSGFLSAGFQIDEEWQRPPNGSQVVLLAKIETIDGRTFEATHSISVTPGGTMNGNTPSRRASQPAGVVPPRQLPADLDEPAAVRKVPDPEPWEFDVKRSAPAGPQGSKESLDAFPAPGGTRLVPGNSASNPPSSDGADPFGGLKTSDNFTEETIPLLR
ncbi:hypothetical protein [Planctomicrobium sp. SH527]|uniref:hypothetical protein n=1 Tax=Planctomicrobium sp. SH527 TaxID=3448123 RepID=UPI003F5C22FA